MWAKKFNLEDSVEIEKIFLADSRDKKRTGRGAFSKVGKGGERAGVKGGLRFPSDSLKGKEKREYKKSGRMNVYNMNEIISYDQLVKKSNEDQKQILEFWRGKYSNTEIMEAMNIEKNKYYKLIDNVGVDKKVLNRGIKTYGDITPPIDEINMYLKKIPNVELFKTWTRPVQYHIMNHWQNVYSIKELGEKMGLTDKNMYSLWGAIRNWIKKNGEQRETFLLSANDDVEQKEKDKKDVAERLFKQAVEVEQVLKNNEKIDEENNEMFEEETVKEEKPLRIDKELLIEKPKEEDPVIEETGITYKLNGVFSSKLLNDKLEKILLLIDDEENDFQISLDLKEIKKTNDDQNINKNDLEMDVVRKSLLQLTEILTKK